MIIVTGAGGGIGAAVAKRLGTSSAVCVNYRTNARGAEAVVETIRAAGGRAIAVRADVGNENDVAQLLSIAERELGPLTGVVNNAGDTGGAATVDSLQMSDFDEACRSTLRSVVLMTKYAGTALIGHGRGGFIINVASTAARTGGAGEWVHYAALKAAVVTHTQGAAIELAPHGVRVNAVSPGLIDTPLHRRNGMPDRPARLSASIPLGRLGEPEEIAAAVAFLGSAEASFIAGANLEASGAR